MVGGFFAIVYVAFVIGGVTFVSKLLWRFVTAREKMAALPLFGILSVLVPVVGAICLFTMEDKPGVSYMTSAFGLVSIFGTWIRHESNLNLRFIGLVLLFPFLVIALFAFALVHSSNWHM